MKGSRVPIVGVGVGVVAMAALASCAPSGQGGADPKRDASKGASNNDTLAIPTTASDTSSRREAFSGEVWADNWFSMSIADRSIIEDSVPLTTERSFNAEVFTFDATRPFVMSFVIADFKENDTGLEYIGERNQQMGDGGFIAQFRSSADGVLVRVSDASWRCLVVHKAPLDKSCERATDPATDCQFETVPEPEGWRLADFDDGSWAPATVHTVADVRPKDGYDEVRWEPSARLIWGPDLERDNTLLCRAWIK